LRATEWNGLQREGSPAQNILFILSILSVLCASARDFRNILGQGVSCHVQLTYTNSFGWFLGSNKYVTTNSTAVPLFADPASFAIHIFN